MASTKYVKSIADDTANGIVDLTRLSNEIMSSSIITALDYIEATGDVLDVWFKDSLSSGDQTTLTTVVGAHTGESSVVEIPQLADGRQIFAPSLFRSDLTLCLPGAGDHATNGIGEGEAFEASSESEGNTTVEWQFNDMVWISGGICMCEGAEKGDYINLVMHAPAATTTAGGGTGNADKVDIGGGLNIIIPASGDGDYNVDLDSSDAVIVPNSSGTGYWDWDSPDIGYGNVTPNATQTGKYDMYDFSNDLSQFVIKGRLLGNNTIRMSAEAVDPKSIPPHWKWKAILHNDGHTGLAVVWNLILARKTTI